jgi:hypothetical protein
MTGFLVAHSSGFPGIEMPRNPTKALTPEELAAFSIGDYHTAAVNHLVRIGAPFCSAACNGGRIIDAAS